MKKIIMTMVFVMLFVTACSHENMVQYDLTEGNQWQVTKGHCQLLADGKVSYAFDLEYTGESNIPTDAVIIYKVYVDEEASLEELSEVTSNDPNLLHDETNIYLIDEIEKGDVVELSGQREMYSTMEDLKNAYIIIDYTFQDQTYQDIMELNLK